MLVAATVTTLAGTGRRIQSPAAAIAATLAVLAGLAGWVVLAALVAWVVLAGLAGWAVLVGWVALAGLGAATGGNTTRSTGAVRRIETGRPRIGLEAQRAVIP
jgi:thiosulfate reductase cytochrome b subunit